MKLSKRLEDLGLSGLAELAKKLEENQKPVTQIYTMVNPDTVKEVCEKLESLNANMLDVIGLDEEYKYVGVDYEGDIMFYDVQECYGAIAKELTYEEVMAL